MTNVTSYERIAKQESAQLKTQNRVILAHSVPCGEPSQPMLKKMKKIRDINHHNKFLKQAALAASLSDFAQGII